MNMAEFFISDDSIKFFNLFYLSKKINGNERIKLTIEGVKSSNNKISLSLVITYENKESERKDISFNKKTVSENEATFLALCLSEYIKFNQNSEAEIEKDLCLLLPKALFVGSKNGFPFPIATDVAFPYYILMRHKKLLNLIPLSESAFNTMVSDIEPKMKKPFPLFYAEFSKLQPTNLQKEAILIRGLRLFPQNTDLIRLLADMYFSQKEYKKYKDLIMPIKKKGRFYNKLFYSLLNLKEYAEAEKILIERQKECPEEDAIQSYDFALLFYKQNKFKQALNYFLHSVQHDIGEIYHFYDSLIYIMDCYIKLKDFQSFNRILNDFIASNYKKRSIAILNDAINILENALKKFESETKFKISKVLIHLYWVLLVGEADLKGILSRVKTDKEMKLAQRGLNLCEISLRYFSDDKSIVKYQSLFDSMLEGIEQSKPIKEEFAPNIMFDKENGTFFINGERVGEVRPGSAHYVFLELLFDNLDLPVSYQKIYDVVLESKGKKIINATPEQLAQRLKSEIKKNFISEIDNILIPTKTKKSECAYRLLGKSRKNLEES